LSTFSKAAAIISPLLRNGNPKRTSHAANPQGGDGPHGRVDNFIRPQIGNVRVQPFFRIAEIFL
jgi:hypothetical protein